MATKGPVTKLSAENQDVSDMANGGLTRRLGLRIAKITKVYPENNTADVIWLWPIRGGNNSIELSKPYIGLRSGIHFTPEIGSIVVVGYSSDRAIMLSYLPPSDYEKLLGRQVDKDNVPANVRKLQPGELSFYSSKSAEIFMHEQIQMTDSALNEISISPSFGISLKSTDLAINNEAGNFSMGMIRRFQGGEEKIITDDGLDVNQLLGGNALTELSIGLKEKADGTNFSDNNLTEAFLNASLGTYVDIQGYKILDQANNEIALNLDLDPDLTISPISTTANITRIQMDKAGNINFNQGNMLTPQEALTIGNVPAPIGSIKQVPLVPYINQSRQRAAREGDRVTIPISPIQTDLDHPQLATKGAVNNVTLQTWIPSSFLCMGIPVVYVPAVAPTKLVGEITQGANGVFVGSAGTQGKSKEALENLQNT